MGLTGWESNDDYERYVTMYDALTYKDMFVSLDLLSNNMSGQQCKLPLSPLRRRGAACLSSAALRDLLQAACAHHKENACLLA